MKYEKKRLKQSLISLAVFVVLLLLSKYRNYLGVYDGYAPYQFAFNVGVFIPCMFILLIIAIVIFIKTMRDRKKYINKTYFYLTISATVPVLFSWVCAIVLIVIALFV